MRRISPRNVAVSSRSPPIRPGLPTRRYQQMQIARRSLGHYEEPRKTFDMQETYDRPCLLTPTVRPCPILPFPSLFYTPQQLHPLQLLHAPTTAAQHPTMHALARSTAHSPLHAAQQLRFASSLEEKSEVLSPPGMYCISGILTRLRERPAASNCRPLAHAALHHTVAHRRHAKQLAPAGRYIVDGVGVEALAPQPRGDRGRLGASASQLHA
ncbi:hypothetical protein PSPO01_13887 [Paraphaeosphaeria sporulosa]